MVTLDDAKPWVAKILLIAQGLTIIAVFYFAWRLWSSAIDLQKIYPNDMNILNLATSFIGVAISVFGIGVTFALQFGADWRSEKDKGRIIRIEETVKRIEEKLPK